MQVKKRFLSILLTICMLFGMLPATAFAAGEQSMPFTDVKETDWFYDSVQYVYDNEMMNGTGDTVFSPDATTTRGMIVTIMHRMEGTPAAGDESFTDVSAGQYYADAVAWANENNIINGYGNAKFGPNDPITREQMAAILYRYAQYKDYDVTASGNLSGFSDAGDISSYAVDSMEWAVRSSLISGMGNNLLAPDESSTRAQIATILMRFCENIAPSNPVEDTYTVTFDYNYDDKGEYESVTAKAGETAVEPDDPTREGYTFGGWYTESDGGSKFDFDTEISADLTLYAKWNIESSGGGGGGGSSSGGEGTGVQPNTTYTVTFDTQVEGLTVESQTVKAGETINEPEDPEREGYTFMGWIDEEGYIFEFDEALESDLILTANWEKTIETTPEQLEELAEVNVQGEVSKEFDNASDELQKVEVTYTLDDIGKVSIEEVNSSPLLRIAGLIGEPIDINALGGEVENATITFHYNPEALGENDPNDLAIVWYDEENDIVEMLENSVVNTTNYTIQVDTTHFSKYAVVFRQLWDTAWDAQLPTIRTDETPYYNIVLAMDRPAVCLTAR